MAHSGKVAEDGDGNKTYDAKNERLNEEAMATGARGGISQCSLILREPLSGSDLGLLFFY